MDQLIYFSIFDLCGLVRLIILFEKYMVYVTYILLLIDFRARILTG